MDASFLCEHYCTDRSNSLDCPGWNCVTLPIKIRIKFNFINFAIQWNVTFIFYYRDHARTVISLYIKYIYNLFWIIWPAGVIIGKDFYGLRSLATVYEKSNGTQYIFLQRIDRCGSSTMMAPYRTKLYTYESTFMCASEITTHICNILNLL